MAAPRLFNADPVLRRGSEEPIYAVGGAGAVIEDGQGNRWLDAASSVFVSILGANPPGVADRIAEAMKRLQFAYSAQFASAEEDALARALTGRAPPGITRAWFVTSGSTANETAVKLARQYHLSRGNALKTNVITRWHSYHGSTIGAMSLSGSGPRRRPYLPYLLDVPHVPPPDLYRRPAGTTEADWTLHCADAFEAQILSLGAEHVSAIMIEPVAGAPLGAMTSPPGYLARLREICDRHDVLMIADEIVSGLGRTGDWFAVQYDGVVPDMLTLAKGLGGGYVPAGAVLIHDRVAEALDGARAKFTHGESFTGHRVMAAAGCAVIDFIEERGLVEQVATRGRALGARLAELELHPLVGTVRGRGFLWGVELVADKDARTPFPRADRMSERVAEAAARRHVMFQTGNAAADGRDGDTVMLAPPYVTTDDQLSAMIDALSAAFDEVAAEINGRAPGR
jgi:adenosylmethionine-8-amino-7-oxononanoate aminotransferase